MGGAIVRAKRLQPRPEIDHGPRLAEVRRDSAGKLSTAFENLGLMD
jgi:hypothetical protein